jgi:hypothetical protein
MGGNKEIHSRDGLYSETATPFGRLNPPPLFLGN